MGAGMEELKSRQDDKHEHILLDDVPSIDGMDNVPEDGACRKFSWLTAY
jgi:hypothetical protein